MEPVERREAKSPAPGPGLGLRGPLRLLRLLAWALVLAAVVAVAVQLGVTLEFVTYTQAEWDRLGLGAMALPAAMVLGTGANLLASPLAWWAWRRVPGRHHAGAILAGTWAAWSVAILLALAAALVHGNYRLGDRAELAGLATFVAVILALACAGLWASRTAWRGAQWRRTT